jgi:hypothetical protein
MGTIGGNWYMQHASGGILTRHHVRISMELTTIFDAVGRSARCFFLCIENMVKCACNADVSLWILSGYGLKFCRIVVLASPAIRAPAYRIGLIHIGICQVNDPSKQLHWSGKQAEGKWVHGSCMDHVHHHDACSEIRIRSSSA